MDIEDPTNITGLASLVNKRYVNKKIDLNELEKTMMGIGGLQAIEERDPAQELQDTLRELAGDDDDAASLVSYREDGHNDGSYSVVGDDLVDETSGAVHNQNNNGPRHSPFSTAHLQAPTRPTLVYNPRIARVETDRPSEWQMNGGDDDAVVFATEPIAARQAELMPKVVGNIPFRSAQQPMVAPIRPRTPPDIYDASIPQPSTGQRDRHERGPLVVDRGYQNTNTRQASDQDVGQGYIDDALRAYGGRATDIDIANENDEDIKTVMLEDIDELMSELEQDGISLKNIPAVNDDSPLPLIEKVHKILRRKYDRKRCQGFGNELILSGAQGLEYVFNGKRQFGPFKPDLTDWHNVARTKLHRMRYETSTIVAGIINDYNLSPSTRLLLELIPSMFLHHRMRKEITAQPTGPTQYNASAMSAALTELQGL